MKRSFDELRARLDAAGLNLVGCAAVAAYDAVVPSAFALGGAMPWARAAIVIGNGGGAFWTRFRAAGRQDGPHPLDAFTRTVVGEAVGPLAAGEGLVWPFVDAEPRVSFVHLAECAGLGRRGLLGTLLHPQYGPWMALRAALLVGTVVEMPRPADGFDPCPTCVSRPCIRACPGSAVTGAGFDLDRCATQRLAVDPDGCAPGCHARLACVYGQEHRPPAAALAFHQAAARAAMATGRAAKARPGG